MTTGTIPDLVRATHERTAIPSTYVEQRAREIQKAGLLPVANGANRPTAKPRDLAHLLLALSADRVCNAPATVNRYRVLQRLVEADHVRAGDALEALITQIWSGDKDAADKTIRIVQTWEEVIVADRNDEQHAGEHFYPEDAVIEFHALDRVRRSIEIPGCVIARIGADLGLRGCQYAT